MTPIRSGSGLVAGSAKSARAEAGAVYLSHDYVPLWKRLLIDIIDVLVVLVFAGALAVGLALLMPTPDTEAEMDRQAALAVLGALFAVWVGYFVLLKGSGHRTLGYRLLGADLVTLQGENPSFLCHAMRALFSVLGPFNFVLDVMWVGGDDCRQALRDKLAHTYVVRAGARPVGRAPVVFRQYTILGATFIFREVSRKTAEHAR